jgi:hypothetical protein
LRSLEEANMKTAFLPLLLTILLTATAPAGGADPSGNSGSTGNPGSSVTVGGEVRLRSESVRNALDLNSDIHDNYEFIRMRSRVAIDAKPDDAMRIYFRFANEYRWGRGLATLGMADPDGKVSIDNGYIDLAILKSHGVRARLGRQDLTYGEGLLVWDGTPSDGSSTGFFDALKLTWKPSENRSLDLFTAKIEDEGFPASPAVAANGTEDLYGVYGNCAHSGSRAFEPYVLYHDKRKATTFANTRILPPRRTVAIGARYSALPATGLRYAAEGAGQTGRVAGVDKNAGGGYVRGGHVASSKLNPGFEVGGLYLSGMWDSFFSDWPKYSELYVYTLSDGRSRISPEDPGSWTNLSAVWGEGSIHPCKRSTLLARVTWLGAAEATGPGPGSNRGILFSGTLNLNLTSNLKGQVLGEIFDPGDYYAPGADIATYGRAQIVTTF